jgi:hypothetical protein
MNMLLILLGLLVIGCMVWFYNLIFSDIELIKSNQKCFQRELDTHNNSIFNLQCAMAKLNSPKHKAKSNDLCVRTNKTEGKK